MLAVTVRTSASGTREIAVDSSHPKPTPGAGEALLRVTLAGICGTDLEILSGYKPLPGPQVIGHEFVATITSYAPDVPASIRLPEHTRVVAEINCVPPGSLSRTATERAQDSTRTAVGIFGRPGAFADFVAVPAENLHPVPPAVPDDAAVFAEPIAAACQILEQIALPRTAAVAVLGAGRLGWLVAHVLSACGSAVTVLTRSRDAERDSRLAETFGVTLGVLGQREMAESFDVVVDCTGSAAGLATAVEVVRPRGTVVLKSTTAPGKGGGVDLTPVVVKEITIVGSRCGPFPVALRLLEWGVVDPRPLVECVFEKKDAVKAFERAGARGVLKVLLK